MRLYVLPGACSLASHIALETALGASPSGAIPPVDVVVVERGRNHGPVYLAVNPLGTVPALVTSDGRVIVESLAVLLHIADAMPAAALAPPIGDPGRDRTHMLLSVMTTTGHTAFQMLWRTERFADTDESRAAVRRLCERRIGVLLDRFDDELKSGAYLLGASPTIADMYLFVLGRWGLRLARPTTRLPNLWRFTERMGELPAVQRAMTREGITLKGPRAGLG